MNTKCYCVAWVSPRTLKLSEIGFYSEPTPTSADRVSRVPLPLFSITARTYEAAEQGARRALRRDPAYSWAATLVKT